MFSKNQETTLKEVSRIFKIDIDFLKSFTEKYGIYFNPPYFDKTHNYWSTHISGNYHGPDSLLYFINEDDYIGSYQDFTIGKKPLKKKFDNAQQYLAWWGQMKDERKLRDKEIIRGERDQIRQTDEKYKINEAVETGPYTIGKTTPGDRWTPAQTEVNYKGKGITFFDSLLINEIVDLLNQAYNRGKRNE